jgi:hypothetical protein
MRRIWHAPASNVRWLWLAISIVVFIGASIAYMHDLKTSKYPSAFDEPLLILGMISFVLVLVTTAYSLRRRFVRGLPGKVQNWLWMHTWIGIITILVALMHENWALIFNNFLTSVAGLAYGYFAPLALISLALLVVSGLFGRLLDVWETRVIAYEASRNNVGIERAVQERLLELDYTIERLSAGKSDSFKKYCQQAIQKGVGNQRPPLEPQELADFDLAMSTLQSRAKLAHSLRRQRTARQSMNLWRSVHIVLSICALITILYHSIMELLANAFFLSVLFPH